MARIIVEVCQNHNGDRGVRREMTHTEMLNRDYYRGRLASTIGDDWVNNWEEQSVVEGA